MPTPGTNPFLKQYGDTEGPLGLPMKDKQAKTLDQLLRALPEEDRTLVRLVSVKAPSELLDGERADVSWITSEVIDRDKEIVIARGMNDSHFAANPLVTMQHAYYCPPVGKSLWRKRVKDGSTQGIKAKTQYPQRPKDWQDDCWPPDTAFSLVKAGLLQGKSVGFLRLKSHAPSSHEIAARPELATVSRIIDEWLLLEYACTFLPTNQQALVESVSKSAITLPPEWLKMLPTLTPTPSAATAVGLAPPVAVPFTPLSEIQAAIKRALAAINPQALAQQAVQRAYDKARGRV
jgi:hypothetical protein